MKIIIAPQAFKGCASAETVAAAMARGVKRAMPAAAVSIVPVADGGDGTLDILIKSKNGQFRQCSVMNALGQKINAPWGVLPGMPQTAVIELARICGLAQLTMEQRNPLVTTTYGVGEVISEVLAKGFRRIFVGLGGSATNDAGTGLARALGVRFLNAKGEDLPLGGGALADLRHIDMEGMNPLLRGAHIIAGCDVTNPLLGLHGATSTYASQKGATPEKKQILERNLEHFAEIALRETGIDAGHLIRGGAAGGTAAGLYIFLHAELVSGADWILQEIEFFERIIGANLVMTGEGRFDMQTAYNKAPFVVAKAAKNLNIPVVAVVGSVSAGVEATGFGDFDLIVPVSLVSLETPPENALALIEETSEEAILKLIRLSMQ